MLSFMLRYLESDSKDDWIGRSKPEQSLQGFHWKNGDDAETLGIWMWSKPYICKNSTGKEIAILLLDTQGVFDDILTTREWAIIVGLCLLTCSSTIFNLFSHLQENSLQILDTFMTYGLIAMNKNSEDESEEEPPFQKLIFLIRDHNNPDQFPYGGIGGKNLLEKKLKIKENMQRETQHTRKHIKECFTDLECFLMPPIGEKAKRVTYDGNLKDLPENFISCLEEFISELLDPEFIIPKVIAGNRIKGNELMEYFKIYLDKFNSGDIPDAMPLLDATAFATYSNATQEAVHQIYFPMMNNKVKKSKFLSDEEIQKLHKNAAQKANQVVENKPKIGDPKILKDALINLNRILDFEFKIMMDENTAKRDKFLKKAVDDCIK
jgi:atlastin